MKKIKKQILAILSIILIILLFTFFDLLIHKLSEEYAVPSRYFTNKIIYGTLIGLITYYLIRNKKLIQKSLIFSATVSILLQARYALEGYTMYFVILFLIIHFAILVPVSYLVFRFILRNK